MDVALLKFMLFQVDWDLGSEEEDIIDQVNGGNSTKSWNLGEDDETANIRLRRAHTRLHLG